MNMVEGGEGVKSSIGCPEAASASNILGVLMNDDR